MKVCFGGVLLSLGALSVIGFAISGLGLSASASPGGHEKVAFSTVLDEAAASRLTAVVVSYGPGEKSPAHHHAGSVFAYVLSGSIRSENSATGPARIYNAGESFFEPIGSVHVVSENASATEPASLLAVFVAQDGAQLTTTEHR